ncbi:MAG: peptidylprolyl isomerase [Halobacteriovoraceae bacterium]|nr:peptidylprolyl isomerase [Halobacteriovoraceae bacterium]|tara:strand:+ start:329 stop:871 length:543 start_codon:yes stop_codon:yes gene_type:complete
MKNTLALSLILFSFIGCIGGEDPITKTDQEIELSNSIKSPAKLRVKTVYGDIIIELDQRNAPLTSERIKALTQEGFYNGLPFHRVIPGHLIQTGDPTGTGEGGSGKNIPFEENDLPHLEGSVAMARKELDKNSGDSQFFICLRDNSKLNGIYVVFGKVTSGLEVAKQISKGDKIITMSVE